MQSDAFSIDLVVRALEYKNGYALGRYSDDFLQQRIIKAGNELGVSHITELIPKILSGEKECSDVLAEVTINVTSMFRAPHVFKYLRALLSQSWDSNKQYKIAHIGCSTGEEVLSANIMLLELGMLGKTRSFAYDISPRAISVAKKSIYKISDFKEFTCNYFSAGGKQEFRNYFEYQSGVVHFNPALTEHTIFSVCDVTKALPEGEFDLVFCRNMLIYYTQHAQDEVLLTISKAMKKDAYLVVGESESLLNSRQFKELSSGNSVYKRN
ncbi:CheR family methyltransferase [Pseudoalteromonas piscicida]